MNLDQFKERWQALDAPPKSDSEMENIVAECRKKVRQFRVGLLLSDVVEIGTGLAMAFVWAFVFTHVFDQHKPLMLLGAAAILFICLVLAGARVLRLRNDKRAWVSVADEIDRQLYAVNQRIWLLRNVIWWYLTPAAVAIVTVLAAAGLEAGNAHLAVFLKRTGIYVGCCTLLYAGIYYLNQRAVRKYLLPLKADLESLLHELEDHSDP